MFVGNNWGGTATVVDARTHRVIKTLNIVPDRRAGAPGDLRRARQAGLLPGRAAGASARDTTSTSTTCSPPATAGCSRCRRPSFADVVWVDLATGKIVAEQQMDGYRTDHMGVSPNGRRLVVSDSTANTVHEYVMGGAGKKRTGQRLRTFESGDTPHENNYTRNGKKIFHASIGRVYTPADYPEVGPVPVGGVHDAVKAARWLEIVKNRRSRSSVAGTWARSSRKPATRG